MKIGILKETSQNETRVAAVPETVAKMIKNGLSIFIETGAGLASGIKDADYQAAGATIVPSRDSLLSAINILLKVTRPSEDEISSLPENSIVIAPCYPLQNPQLINDLSEKRVSTFSLDLLPRIARAQSMDILSSMSSIAGYKSVILAAQYSGKLFPMMTTAAGTIPPAKVIVIGAGVAGLQAIATARRLGGVVVAFDTRPAAGEQVKSLGADFVALESSQVTEDVGGYAKEQSAAFYKHEQEMIASYIKEADVVISTALIPGKRAPLLITEEMVKTMKPGAVIVDLAAEQKGNCELTEPSQIIEKHGITIIGLLNLPGTVPIHASQLFAKNLLAFLNYIASQLANNKLDLNDDIIKNTLVTHHGEILHPTLKSLLQEKGMAYAS